MVVVRLLVVVQVVQVVVWVVVWVLVQLLVQVLVHLEATPCSPSPLTTPPVLGTSLR